MQQLKSKKEINSLFESGFTQKSGDLVLRYFIKETHTDFFVGVAVSKTKFRRAVDRNRIKRQLRAALSKVNKDSFFLGVGMLIFSGNSLPYFQKLEADCKTLFKKINHKEEI